MNLQRTPQGSYVRPFQPQSRSHFVIACSSPPVPPSLFPPLLLEAINPTSTRDATESRARSGEMNVCLAQISLGSLSGTTGGSLEGSRTLLHEKGGLVSKACRADWLVCCCREEPGCAWIVVLAVGVLRFERFRGAGSPGGWRGVGLASLRRS